jgi:hypothetical protein
MSIPKYHTIGAVALDARTLNGLGNRLASLELAPDSMLVLARRRDAELVENVLPEALVRHVQTGLSRMQWFEFASTFFSASTVSFLMGVVHLWTGLVVQAILTVASVVGLIAYHRRPRLKKQLLALGLPERLAEDWAEVFPSGFALMLATVPEESSEDVQEAFLADDNLISPLAVDRRPVL